MFQSTSHTWPRAILHLDGDCFFVGCEIARNPKLKGKPVVVGAERGIACAMSYEAKQAGVTRGMPLHLVRRVCPEVIILPGDHESYSLYSTRMSEIVRRYTPEVEEYSIDECFADLTGLHRLHRKSYEEIAREIKNVLRAELGLVFSVGLSINKVLAKIASKWQKPNGFTVITQSTLADYLPQVPIGTVWGIGPNTAKLLSHLKVQTAFDLTQINEDMATRYLAKPYLEIRNELQGKFVLPLNVGYKKGCGSISKTKTFTPASNNKNLIFSQLSQNIEGACLKLRRQNLLTSKFSIFLKTQNFIYNCLDISLPWPTNTPTEILDAINLRFKEVYQVGQIYRATGITLSSLSHNEMPTLGLFGEAMRKEKNKIIYRQMDSLDHRFGAHTVFLGSSLFTPTNDRFQKSQPPKRKKETGIYNLNKKRRLSLLSLGKVN